MKKILMALILCLVSICGFGQSLGQLQKTNNLFEYINNGVNERIYINQQGQYVIACKITGDHTNTSIWTLGLGDNSMMEEENRNSDGGYIEVILGSNKDEALESIKWIKDLYDNTKDPVSIEQNGKTLVFDRIKSMWALKITDGIIKGAGYIWCNEKFVNFYIEAIETNTPIRVNNMGKRL